MAGYVTWYGKKRVALEKHERALSECLGKGGSASELEELAERVRAAQIRALRSKRYQLPPSEKNAVGTKNLDREIKYWAALATEAIIAGYRCNKLSGHRSSAVRRGAKRFSGTGC